jgi:hypothetical protein
MPEKQYHGMYDTDRHCNDPPDDSLRVEIGDFDSNEVYGGRGVDIPIRLTNPTNEYLTEKVLLRPYYGRDLLTGEFTIPPNKSRTYTSLWEPGEAQAGTRNQIYATTDNDCAAIDVTPRTRILYDARYVGPENPTIGDALSFRLTLENVGQVSGYTNVAVTHHIAGRIKDPSKKPPGQTTIYNETHRLQGGFIGDGETETVTVTYTPDEPGHHIFRISNEQSETSLPGVTVTK